MSVNETAPEKRGISFAPLLNRLAVWSFIVLLAWTPFPLGSAISWGAGFFEMMVAFCWVLWILANFQEPSIFLPRDKYLYVPLIFYIAVLVWALVQTLPVLPGLAHPIWLMASDALKQPLPAVISLNPWRTKAELVKLAAYGAVGLLACSMARSRATAALLFKAVIVIGALYAIYGFVLAAAGVAQAQIVYQVPIANLFVSGPFMLHNSFATYCGLALLAATSLLFTNGSSMIVLGRGARRFGLSVINYLLGAGAPWLIASLLLFAGVSASESRGGFAATTGGLLAMGVLASWVASRAISRFWAFAGVGAALSPLVFFVLFNNDTLSERFADVVDAGTADDIRLALWSAAHRMIETAPWQGLGLGSFQDAYPLYATQIFPYVMDKAHCDYLELAAGLGLPAAILCWLSLLWLGMYCLRGALIRRRDRFFALTGFCATVLIAIHSAVDFSLQLPAVATSFATLIGIGAAQATRSAAKRDNRVRRHTV